MARRSFGALRKLPSKRWQASYIGPDTLRHPAPFTFTAKADAEAWLMSERALLETGRWTPPKGRNAVTVPTLHEYADRWLEHRELRPRTRTLYRSYLDRHILPPLGELPLTAITPARARDWHDNLDTGPRAKSGAYSLLRTIMQTATDDELIVRNPVNIRNAGRTRRQHKVTPLTPAQVDTAAAAMPDRLRALLLLTAWCGLRIGEALELRRFDLDVSDDGQAVAVKVRRAVSRMTGEWLVGPPKTMDGLRDVVVPPHIVPAVRKHLDEFTGAAPDALLFPSPSNAETWLQRSTLNLHWKPAAEAAGVPGARWHDLRHTGATLAAIAGATVPELMQRLGHSTPAAAMRYQHAAQGRDAAIAGALSRLAEGTDAEKGKK